MVDGGMTNNGYMMQYQSNLIGDLKVMDVKDCTLLGAGYLAGLYFKQLKGKREMLFKVVKRDKKWQKVLEKKFKRFDQLFR